MKRALLAIALLALSLSAGAVETGTVTFSQGMGHFSQYATDTTGSVALTFTATSRTEIDEVRLHLSAGGAATNYTVTIDRATTALLDVVVTTVAMSGVTDNVWKPTRPVALMAGDKLVLAYTNGGNTTWGAEVLYFVRP